MSEELISTIAEGHTNRRQTAGDILRAAMQPAPAEPEETQEVEAEAPVETEETAEEQTTETIEATEEQEAEVSEETGVAIDTLTELAEAIEVDNDFLYNIKVPMPDGQEPVSLSELKDAYTGKLQTTTEAEAALNARREAFEKEQEETRQRIAAQQAQIQQMPDELLAAEADVRAIAKQYQTFDWSELEKVDPGRAALEKQNLATQYSQAEARAQEIRNDIQKKQEQSFQQMQAEQQQKILTTFPKWADPVVAQKEFGEISSLLNNYGFNQQELQYFGDSRILKLLSDYSQLKNQASEAKTVRKKVVKTPKSLKPGAPKVDQSAAQKREALIQKAAESRDSRVKVRAIGDLLNSNRG
jgi:hypothetical protein